MPDTHYTILVVDDLPDWRATLSGLLEDVGYRVQAASSSDKALDLLASDCFNLAVLDVRLDETDEGNTEGISLARKIKEHWPSVKVVIITGYGTSEIIKQAIEPDTDGSKLAVDYIPKTQTEDLIKIVQKALAQ